jgi:opacity protein-like surface antigen
LRIIAAVMAGLCILLAAGNLRAAPGRGDGPTSGFYLSLAPFVTDAFTVETSSPVLSPGKTETKRGFGLAGGLGYRHGDLRVEGEFMYGRNDADRVSFAGGGGPLSGYYDLYGATINFFYDIPTTISIRPYVGAGLGGARLEAHGITLAGFPPTRGSSTVFACKLMAGFSYALTDAWRLILGYRFLSLGGQDYETGGIPLHGDPIRSHALQTGVQWYF